MGAHDARIRSAIEDAKLREQQQQALGQMLAAAMEAPSIIQQIVTCAIGIGTSPGGVPVLMVALLTGERLDVELQPHVQQQIIDGLEFARNLNGNGTSADDPS
jgi:hypothetical protein